MGLGRKKGPGGGGAALNFKVVPGLTQPGTASKNTIWVKAEKIGVWYFSATQPEGLQEWDVWFPTGAESAVEFNALKKNAVQVYPLTAKQMVSGSLVTKEAETWNGSTWIKWFLDSEFVRNGMLNPTKRLDGQLRSGQSISVTQNSGYVRVNATSNVSGGIATGESVNVTNYSKLTLYCNVINPGAGFGITLTNGVNYSSADALNKGQVASKETSTAGVQTLELPLSAYSGYYYVGILMNNATGKLCDAYVYDFYLS